MVTRTGPWREAITARAARGSESAASAPGRREPAREQSAGRKQVRGARAARFRRFSADGWKGMRSVCSRGREAFAAFSKRAGG